MARTSRNSSKNRPTDKRSKRQDLVTTSPPPRKWTPILWSRSIRSGKSPSSGRNGHDRPSESALAREIRGIVLLLFGIFLAGALAAEGYTQLHGTGNVKGNFGWIGALLAHPIAQLLGWPAAARRRTRSELVAPPPTPGERAGLDASQEIVVPGPDRAASVVSATLLEPTPEEMPQIDHSLIKPSDEEPLLPIERKRERKSKTAQAAQNAERISAAIDAFETDNRSFTDEDLPSPELLTPAPPRNT